MNRLEKIKLLNGLLKGNLHIAVVFADWPEKTFYTLPHNEDFCETEDGDLVSLAEVDHELMNYPKVRICAKDTDDENVKLSFKHEYLDKNVGDE